MITNDPWTEAEQTPHWQMPVVSSRLLRTYAYERQTLSQSDVLLVEAELKKDLTLVRRLNDLMDREDADMRSKGVHGDYE